MLPISATGTIIVSIISMQPEQRLTSKSTAFICVSTSGINSACNSVIHIQ